ncbi:MAG: phosphotransferase [archaeon]
MTEGIDINKFQEVLSKELGEDLVVTGLEKVGEGYHSDGFKLLTNKGEFFIKKVKSEDFGFELPERKIYSLLLSEGMARRANANPKMIGVLVGNDGEIEKLPTVNSQTEIYHIQAFGGKGKSYLEILQEKKYKQKIDEKDTEEIQKLVDFIAKVHSLKHPSSDGGKLKAVYNDCLRNVISNPELTMVLLQDFPNDHVVFPLEAQKNYLALMYDLISRFKDRSERLTALHGDFWGANCFFSENEELFVVDYSRMPWGDPGIDIGWFVCQYLWLYHETKNEYFKELGELFLKKYEEKTGDKEIREGMSLIMGLQGVIYLLPKFYPNRDKEVSEMFMQNIVDIMKAGRFKWNRI